MLFSTLFHSFSQQLVTPQISGGLILQAQVSSHFSLFGTGVALVLRMSSVSLAQLSMIVYIPNSSSSLGVSRRLSMGINLSKHTMLEMEFGLRLTFCWMRRRLWRLLMILPRHCNTVVRGCLKLIGRLFRVIIQLGDQRGMRWRIISEVRRYLGRYVRKFEGKRITLGPRNLQDLMSINNFRSALAALHAHHFSLPNLYNFLPGYRYPFSVISTHVTSH